MMRGALLCFVAVLSTGVISCSHGTSPISRRANRAADHVLIVQIDGLTSELLEGYLTSSVARSHGGAMARLAGVESGADDATPFSRSVYVRDALGVLPATADATSRALLSGSPIEGGSAGATMLDLLRQAAMTSATAGIPFRTSTTFEAPGTTDAERIARLVEWLGRSPKPDLVAIRFDSLFDRLTKEGTSGALDALSAIDRQLESVLYGGGKYGDRDTVVIITSGFGYIPSPSALTRINSSSLERVLDVDPARVASFGGLVTLSKPETAELQLLAKSELFRSVVVGSNDGKGLFVLDRDLGALRPAIAGEIADPETETQLLRMSLDGDAIGIVERRGCAGATSGTTSHPGTSSAAPGMAEAVAYGCYEITSTDSRSAMLTTGGLTRQETRVPLLFAGAVFEAAKRSAVIAASVVDVPQTALGLLGMTSGAAKLSGRDLTGALLQRTSQEQPANACEQTLNGAEARDACARFVATTADRAAAARALLQLFVDRVETDEDDARRAVRLALWLQPKLAWPARFTSLRALAPTRPIRCRASGDVVVIAPEGKKDAAHAARHVLEHKLAAIDRSYRVGECELSMPAGASPLETQAIAALVARTLRADVLVWANADPTPGYFAIIPTPELAGLGGPSQLGGPVTDSSLPTMRSLAAEATPGQRVLDRALHLLHAKKGFEAWRNGWTQAAKAELAQAKDLQGVERAYAALILYWLEGSPWALAEGEEEVAEADNAEYIEAARAATLLASLERSGDAEQRWAAALRAIPDALNSLEDKQPVAAPNPQDWKGTKRAVAEALNAWISKEEDPGRCVSVQQSSTEDRLARLDRVVDAAADIDAGLAARVALSRVSLTGDNQRAAKYMETALQLAAQPGASWARQGVLRSLLSIAAWNTALESSFDRARAEQLYFEAFLAEVDHDTGEGREDRNVSRAIDLGWLKVKDEQRRRQILATLLSGTDMRAKLIRPVVAVLPQVLMSLLQGNVVALRPQLEGMRAALKAALAHGEPSSLDERVLAGYAEAISGLLDALGAKGGFAEGLPLFEQGIIRADDLLDATPVMVRGWREDRKAERTESSALQGLYLRAGLTLLKYAYDISRDDLSAAQRRAGTLAELAAVITEGYLGDAERERWTAHIRQLRDVLNVVLTQLAMFVAKDKLEPAAIASLRSAVKTLDLPLTEDPETVAIVLATLEIIVKDVAWVADLYERGAKADKGVYKAASDKADKLAAAWKPSETKYWFIAQAIYAAHEIAGNALPLIRETTGKAAIKRILSNDGMSFLLASIDKRFPASRRLADMRAGGDMRMLILDIVMSIMTRARHGAIDDDGKWAVAAFESRAKELARELEGEKASSDVVPGIAMIMALSRAREDDISGTQLWTKRGLASSPGTSLEGNEYVWSLIELAPAFRARSAEADKIIEAAGQQCASIAWPLNLSRAVLQFERGDRTAATASLQDYLFWSRTLGTAAMVPHLQFTEIEDEIEVGAHVGFSIGPGFSNSFNLNWGVHGNKRDSRTMGVELKPLGNPTQAATHARVYEAWMAFQAGDDASATRLLADVVALGHGLDPALLHPDLARAGLPVNIPDHLYLDPRAAFWVAVIAEQRGYVNLAALLYQSIVPELMRRAGQDEDDELGSETVCNDPPPEEPWLEELTCEVPRSLGNVPGDLQLARLVALRAQGLLDQRQPPKWSGALASASRVAPTLFPAWVKELDAARTARRPAPPSVPAGPRALLGLALGDNAQAAPEALLPYSCEALLISKVSEILPSEALAGLAERCGIGASAVQGYLDAVMKSTDADVAIDALIKAIALAGELMSADELGLWSAVDNTTGWLLNAILQANATMMPRAAHLIAEKIRDAGRMEQAWLLRATATTFDLLITGASQVSPASLIRDAAQLSAIADPELLKLIKKIEFQARTVEDKQALIAAHFGLRPQ